MFIGVRPSPPVFLELLELAVAVIAVALGRLMPQVDMHPGMLPAPAAAFGLCAKMGHVHLVRGRGLPARAAPAARACPLRHLEERDRALELLGLGRQLFGRGRHLLGRAGVLLDHLVQLLDRAVDLVRARASAPWTRR